MNKEELKSRLTTVVEYLKRNKVSDAALPVIALSASGYQADEIGDKTNIATNTARKHISNSKEKIGYHKDTELAGFFLCKMFDVDYEELREVVKEFVKSEKAKRIVATFMLATIVFTLPVEHFEITRGRRSSRSRTIIETRTEIKTEA